MMLLAAEIYAMYLVTLNKALTGIGCICRRDVSALDADVVPTIRKCRPGKRS